MSNLNSTPSADRIHIGFFGLRNAGKSSLVNAVTGQSLSVVSDVAGTTTDPVKKAMELLPLGPVVIIDTPGLDDEGMLGELRVQKAREVLATVHIAVLVVDATRGMTELDNTLISLFEERKLPYVIALNKCDLLPVPPAAEGNRHPVSAATGAGVHELKEAIAAHAKGLGNTRKLVSDLLSPDDLVVLVIPIDESAPKGRLILPQQNTIRDILDSHCTVVACQDTELKKTLSMLAVKPALVITDSQAFGRVAKDVPADVPLTSFSILFARYKGDLTALVRGAVALSSLKDGDRVVIAEGCTHHRQCGDIGSVKIPRWVEQFSGAKPIYTFTSGGEFPHDLSDCKLIIHCGGCMLNEKEMAHRMEIAERAGVPMVNYGVAIAHMHGILKKSLSPFPEVEAILRGESQSAHR
ncbi:MAG: [FeFe] hydrogenase H-cluster maturation GTPase HydF [Clostridia bacterium]|nr:[FeFe] hydrogenase H-cluster maturation GTPase HydF [Clostridia bacterium]